MSAPDQEVKQLPKHRQTYFGLDWSCGLSLSLSALSKQTLLQFSLRTEEDDEVKEGEQEQEEEDDDNVDEATCQSSDWLLRKIRRQSRCTPSQAPNDDDISQLSRSQSNPRSKYCFPVELPASPYPSPTPSPSQTQPSNGHLTMSNHEGESLGTWSRPFLASRQQQQQKIFLCLIWLKWKFRTPYCTEYFKWQWLPIHMATKRACARGKVEKGEG